MVGVSVSKVRILPATRLYACCLAASIRR
jgi:hypothetical protein